MLSFDDSNGNSLSLFISLIYLTFVRNMFYVDGKMLHLRVISEDFMRQEGFVWYEKGLAFWAVEKATFFRASKLRIISRRRVRWRGFWLWKCLVIPKAKRKQTPEAGKLKVKRKKLNPKPHMPKKIMHLVWFQKRSRPKATSVFECCVRSSSWQDSKAVQTK